MKPLIPVLSVALVLANPFNLVFRSQPVYANQPATPISHDQAQVLMHAVGQVYLREQLTYSLLADCAGEYKHLSDSASRAKLTWQATNNPTVLKSRHIQELVSQSIQAQRSDYDAVKFTLDVEALINRSVADFRTSLASKSRKQRHYLCNRLILSISAGKWDLQQRIPQAVTTISDFEE
ncbi:MAG: hypothetical protein PVG75_02990 [Thioalkalispiraceae bacterium]|jgi:hypothetical protein